MRPPFTGEIDKPEQLKSRQGEPVSAHVTLRSYPGRQLRDEIDGGFVEDLLELSAEIQAESFPRDIGLNAELTVRGGKALVTTGG